MKKKFSLTRTVCGIVLSAAVLCADLPVCLAVPQEAAAQEPYVQEREEMDRTAKEAPAGEERYDAGEAVTENKDGAEGEAQAEEGNNMERKAQAEEGDNFPAEETAQDEPSAEAEASAEEEESITGEVFTEEENSGKDGALLEEDYGEMIRGQEARGAYLPKENDASAIQLDRQYSGSLTESVPVHVYKFTLPQSGLLTINAQSEDINRLYYVVYYSELNGSGVFGHSDYNSTLGVNAGQKDFRLTAGTYYLCIGEEFDSDDGSFGNDEVTAGNFRFTLSLDGVGESFKEQNGGSNNSIAAASRISLNKTYTGQIALNDEEDYFQFSLSNPSVLTISIPAATERIHYEIYGKDGKEICYNNYGYQGRSEEYHLTKGTYYLRVYDGYDDTFMYKFKLTAKAVPETFPDIDGEGNNTVLAAKAISLRKVYKGQIAENDKVDFFRFNINKTLKIMLNVSNERSLDYKIYDYNGNEQWKGYGGGVHTTELSKGTYYLGVHRSWGGSSPYSFRLSVYQPASAQISSLENTSKGIALTWNSVSGASGYKIYRRQGKGGYKLIKTIKKGGAVSYTDKKVSNKKTYTYKLKTVEKSYSSVYGTAKSIYCMKSASGVKKLSKTSGGFKASLKKVKGATGYEVQYSSSSSFSYPSSVKTKKTTAKISAYRSSYYKHTYYVRVRPYKKIGKKMYYGPWSGKKWITI